MTPRPQDLAIFVWMTMTTNNRSDCFAPCTHTQGTGICMSLALVKTYTTSTVPVCLLQLESVTAGASWGGRSLHIPLSSRQDDAHHSCVNGTAKMMEQYGAVMCQIHHIHIQTFCSANRPSIILPARSSILFLSTICSSTTSRETGSPSWPAKMTTIKIIIGTAQSPPGRGEAFSLAIQVKSPTLSRLTSNATPYAWKLHQYIQSVHECCAHHPPFTIHHEAPRVRASN